MAKFDDMVVSDLAALMERAEIKIDAFYDESFLPHRKEEFLAAIEREILRGASDEIANIFAFWPAEILSRFQPGIGKNPLFWLGADLAEPERTTPNPRDRAMLIADNPDVERAKIYQDIMLSEAKTITTRIAAAISSRVAQRAASGGST